jgi:dipeptidyl aminopeptidase/acylaminoacyl peptidase
MYVIIFLAMLQAPGKGSNLKQTPTGQANRPVTVADAIAMIRLADPQYIAGGPTTDVAIFCPNRTQFVVVVRKGNIEQNTNEYQLLLWKTNEVFRSPTPKLLVQMSSSSNRPAIEDVTWRSDNTLEFLGEQPGALHQLYTVDASTRELRQVTMHPTNVLSARMSSGKEVAFVAAAPSMSFFDRAALHNGVVVSTQRLSYLITDQAGGPSVDDELFIRSRASVSRRIRVSDAISSPWDRTPYLSPDGKHIVILTRVAHIPHRWREYADPMIQHLASQELDPGQYSWLRRYVLVDVATGRNRVLLDSPISPAGSKVVWLSSGDAVVLAGVYLPLDGPSGEEQAERRSNLYAVEVNVGTGRVTEITHRDLTLNRWEPSTNDLVFEAGRSQGANTNTEIFFHKSGDRWQEAERSANQAKLAIILQEDMNTPPRILAVDSIGHQQALLLDLNPQFERLSFGRVEELRWKLATGREVVGGLYYPVNYIATRKYPLVIQTHGWRRDRFWIDGPYSTAFAAQPMAGKGIMVLQLSEPTDAEAEMDTPNEVDKSLSDIEGAIDYLNSRKMIDIRYVGIIGFSRTCLYVKYALTHSRLHFAAASITDGVDGGYFQYVENLNFPAFAQFEEGVNGGNPFGAGLKSWIDRSPSFTIEKVEAPVRIVSPNMSTVLAEWEWFAALTRLHKPVDMIAMRDGDHILQRPWERIVSQQGNVDWFCFWLKDEEDPDPSRTTQYDRWRQMRDKLSIRH